MTEVEWLACTDPVQLYRRGVKPLRSSRRRMDLFCSACVRLVWHLLDDDLLTILTHPEIVESVAAILGPDLLLWRSKVFAKRPGEGELGWHQEWGAFNGEEIGNDRPSLEPSAAARLSNDPWNVTVWIALDDVADDMGPIRFARGTHRRRFPITMKPLLYSEFWHDPFLGIGSVGEIVTRAYGAAA